MFEWGHVSAAQRRLVLPQHLQSLTGSPRYLETPVAKLTYRHVYIVGPFQMNAHWM